MPKHKIRVDHYVGQGVTGVEKTGDADHQWTITLEGGATIHNRDGRKKSQPNLQNLTLFQAIEDDQKGSAELHFGRPVVGESGIVNYVGEVIVNFPNYGSFELGDPNYGPTDDEPTADDLPEDPSPHRVASGPAS